MGLYAVWSSSFVFTETVNYFSISSSVTGLSGRELMFPYLKYYLSFVFDFGVFILIVFAIEPKKLLNLIGIGLIVIHNFAIYVKTVWLHIVCLFKKHYFFIPCFA